MVATTDILRTSDIMAGATTYALGSVFGMSSQINMRAAEAVVISALARFLAMKMSPAQLDAASTEVKEEAMVGILHAANAAFRKRNVVKSTVMGITADLVAERSFGLGVVDDMTLIQGLGGTTASTTGAE